MAREHRRLREQVKRTVDAGAAVCWRCGQFIEAGTPFDLAMPTSQVLSSADCIEVQNIAIAHVRQAVGNGGA